MRWGPRALVIGLVIAAGLAGCLDDGGDQPSADDEVAATPNRTGVTPAENDLPNVTLEEVTADLEKPIATASPNDGTGRLFVLEQEGRVRVVDSGSLVEESYLDLTDRVGMYGWEQGLLGLAFDPNFTDNGRLYTSFTNTSGHSVVLRHTVENPASGRPAGEGHVIFSLDQPEYVHNGGHIVFGPDGYLYLGLGDGGPPTDPDERAQNANSVFGALLRMDVSGDEPKPPADNPFVDREGHDLVWVYGFRNPWRFSFDPETGDLFVADVGQEGYEEVDHQPASSEGGENYGWNEWEGDYPFEGDPSREGYVFPEISYPNGENGACAVIGGHVYRGQAIPELQGAYLHTDLCNGTIQAAYNTSEGWVRRPLLETDLNITSFGRGEDGEIYVTARQEGALYRLVPEEPLPA